MSKSITINVLWKFAERFTAQIVSFVISLVLARLLSPNDYGAIAIVLVFINIANVFVSNGFGSSLIQKKEADELDFSSIFYFNLLFSIVIYLSLFFLAPMIASFYKINELVLIIRVLGVRLIFASVNSVQQAYVAKKMQFKKFFWSTFCGTFFSGVTGLILAYLGCGVWALVIQYLTNTIIDTCVLFVTISWRPKKIFSISRVVQLLKFGWKILFEGLSESIVGQLKTVVIGKVYTPGDLGYFSKAQQFPSLVMTNISSAIGAVLFSAMSEEQDDVEKVKCLMRKSIKVCSYVLFPLLTGLAMVGPNLIPVLLTEKWMEVVPYLYILSFSTLLTVGMYPRHQAMKAIGRSDVYMNEHIIARIINIVLLILVYKISTMAIAILEIVNGVVLTITLMYTSYKYNKYRVCEQVKDIMPIICMNIVMGGVVYAVNFISATYFVKLIVQIVFGVVTYLVLSLILKPEGYFFVKNCVVKFVKRG